jgi:hypothetical protein
MEGGGMNIKQLDSGIVLAENPSPPPAPPPPEHPVCEVIRKHLKWLNDDLAQFEQTTHGSILGDGSLEKVCEAIADAYNGPDWNRRAYFISELSQRISRFLKAKT